MCKLKKSALRVFNNKVGLSFVLTAIIEGDSRVARACNSGIIKSHKICQTDLCFSKSTIKFIKLLKRISKRDTI